MNRLFVILLFISLSQTMVQAQTPIADSLLASLAKSKQDTTSIRLLKELFLEFEYQDPVQAEKFLNEAFLLSEKYGDKKTIADIYILKGYLAEDNAEYTAALENYLSALRICESIKHKPGISTASANVASVYLSLGNYPEALRFLFAALKIDEASGDKSALASTYAHIAIVYGTQGNYKESLRMHKLSLGLSKKINDDLGVAYAYNNIGNIYVQLGRYEDALENFALSLEMKKKLGDERGLGSAFNNMASAYAYLADTRPDPSRKKAELEKAMANARLSLGIRLALNDAAGQASVYSNMGVISMKQKKFKEARENLNISMKIATDIGYKEYIRENYFNLAQLDSTMGDYKGAYGNHKLFVIYRDSLVNEETRKKTIQSQMTYNFEKKEAVAKAEHAKELENQEMIANEKSQKQKVVLALVSVFLLLVVVFALFIFRSLRMTKKQKAIIEKQKELVEIQKAEVEQQKHMVEEHQKEIIDSITYARRIQRSLLPTEKYIEKHLNRLMKN